jgi:hypothetical protein
MTDLDPWPYRTFIGTRGKYLEKYRHIIEFDPRPEYEQDFMAYPLEALTA